MGIPVEALLNGPVLVADDDPGVRVMLRDVLEIDGVRVATVETGDALADEVCSCRPALAIVDADLPRLGGNPVLKEVDSMCHEIPVVFISSDPDLRERTQGVGAVACLEEPFDIDELRAIVRHYVRQSE